MSTINSTSPSNNSQSEKLDSKYLGPISPKILSKSKAELKTLAKSLRDNGMAENEIYYALSTMSHRRFESYFSEEQIKNIAQMAAADPIEEKIKARTPTDDELAQRYITRFPHTAYGNGGWRRYKQGTWPLVDDDVISHEILEVIRTAKKEGIRPTRNLLGSVEEIVRVSVSLPGEKWDSDPDIIICKNGALQISTKKLLPHNPEYFATFGLDFNFDPNAEARAWNYFIKTSLPNTSDFLQEFAGLSLTTDMSFETAIWLYGPPGSGKSTFLEGLQTMLGPRTAVLGLADIERSRFSLWSLIGKTLVQTSEQPSKLIQSSHILNSIISGEKISVEKKFRDPIEITPFAKIAWAMNELPTLSQASNGLFRRVKVVKFDVLDEKLKDISLKKAISNEGPGILNWALAGLSRLQNRGRFEFPPCVLDATDEFQQANDIPAIFVSECCITDPSFKVQAQELYKTYQNWCYENGNFPLSSTSLASSWIRLGFTKSLSNGKTYWHGIGIRSSL